MKRQTLKKVLASVLGLSMVIPNVPMQQVRAEEPSKITIEEVSAKSHSAHGVELIKDGRADTFWQSIPTNGEGDRYKSMYAHNRYIDITLDGMYDLTEIKIFNKVDDSYNNYYVYASVDGVNYDKIISKTSDDKATNAGDSYDVDVTASHLRLNMAYNSNTAVTNLAEIEVFGNRIGERQDDTSGIQVSDWEGSEWQKEWDRFESDQEYAKTKILSEMKNLVGRVIGDEWKDEFIFRFRGTLQDEKDIFEIRDGEKGKIIIYGNNGMAMASGFNYYLKNYVNVDFNPLFGSNVNVKEIVSVGTPVIKEAQYNLRYALNFCTYSYTMAFWNWDEYEEFLDWAAMNGINLILDIVGQEEVLRQTFLQYGFTEKEIKDYICGPAYYAWFYMQNLYSVGGPLPDSWFEQRTELGRRIHDRMQVYSITPVLQGFAGQVPETFPQKNPGAQLAPVDGWSGHTRPALLMTYVSADKTDYFPQVAKTFYDAQKNVFGDITDYYATDPFHEGGNTGGLDTATIFQVVQQKMMESNPDAIWVMQQWQNNLNSTKMSKMDKDHALALYLQADMAARGNYKNEEMVFENNGTPWIYNMLHNFGGRMGLDGEIPWISENPMTTFQNKNNMVGIGITPEALENSPVIYELFWETLWSKDPLDYRSWLEQYARRRAGGDSESLQKAWEILLETAYANKKSYIQGPAETVMNARPADTFTAGASTWGHSKIEYEKSTLDEALILLAENYEAFKESEAFRYDLAEVAEQVICNVAIEHHSKMVEAKNARNLDQFTYYSNQFLKLFDLAEQVLSSTDEFMLGTWIEAARKMIQGADDWTKDLFEYNARSLLTTWGGENAAVNGRLKDYSNRKWAGLTSSFYKERWSIWIRNRKADIQGVARNPEDDKAESNWFLWEYQWNNRKSDDENGKYSFPTTVVDTDLGTLGKQIYNQYSYTAFLKEGESNQSLENALKDIIPTLEGTTASGKLENITDGSAGEGWIADGTGNQVLTFNLQKTYELKNFVLSILQLAKEFPYNYKLESFNPNENEWEVIDEYTQNSMGSNTEINTGKTYISNKLRLTMNTTDDINSPLTITEFAAYGIVTDTVEYKNLALNLKAKLNVSTDGSSSDAYITDGNTGNLWKTPWPYEEGYPANVEIDLGAEKYIDHIEVYFEKPGKPFKFVVSITKEDGTTKEVYTEYKEHAGTLPSGIFNVPVGEEAGKVTVSFVGTTGQGAEGASTPALSEIMVMGIDSGETEIKETIEFTRVKVEGISVAGGNATNNLLDGNKGSFDKVDKNTEVLFTLSDDRYVEEVQVTFEKGQADAPNNDGLSIRYQLLGVDKDGNRFTILDKSTTDEILPARTITIPVKAVVSQLIFIHNGNSGQGNAYAAESRVYEFEVWGRTPENVAVKSEIFSEDSDNITVLKDGKADTGYKVEAGDVLTVNLPNASDIEWVGVEKKDDTTGKLQYQTEYYDQESGSWILLCTVEGAEAENKIYGKAEIPGYSDQVRFTFSEACEIAELEVYVADYTSAVAQKINAAREYVKNLTYGDNYGEYKNDARTELEAVLTEIENQLTGGVDETLAEKLQKDVEKALREFKKNGIVYISRDNILLSISKAAAIIDVLETKQDLADVLNEIKVTYNDTLTIYNTYAVTQQQLDEQAALLSEKINPYENLLPQEIIEYMVSFDSNGGSPIEQQFVSKDGLALKPSDPVLEGYTFIGWFIGETEYDFSKGVTENITLTAKWEKDGTGSDVEIPGDNDSGSSSDNEGPGDNDSESSSDNEGPSDNDSGSESPSDNDAPGVSGNAGLWVTGIEEEYFYTGSAIKPDIKVYDGDRQLIEKKDYTVVHKNNKNAYEENDRGKNAPYVEIRMKGNNKGNTRVYYKITKIDLSETMLEEDKLTAVVKQGKTANITPVLYWQGKKLKLNKDYEIEGSIKTLSAGNHTITINGKNNFDGKLENIPVQISNDTLDGKTVVPMNKLKIKVSEKKLQWKAEGAEFTNFDIMGKPAIPSEGEYDTIYYYNKSAGTGYLVIKGNGNDENNDNYVFLGTKTFAFKIEGITLNTKNIIVDGFDGWNYNYGKAICPIAELKEDGTPAATLKSSREQMVEGVHYTVVYSKNQEKGIATATFTGLPEAGYTGTMKKTFKINPAPIGQLTYDVSGNNVREDNNVYYMSFTKGGTTPEIIIKTPDGRKLISGKDYTVKYSGNKKIGETATAIVKGKGNYDGSFEVKFVPEEKEFLNENGIRIEAKDKIYSDKDNNWNTTVKVLDSNGKALTKKEYEIISYTIIEARDESRVGTTLETGSKAQVGDKIEVKVQGKGDYTSQADSAAIGIYSIIQKGNDISKASFKLKAKEYTGEAIEITDNGDFDKKSINPGNRSLELGKDFEVVEGSYLKNIDKGTAKVTLKGIGEYGGTKTVTFKINQRDTTNQFEIVIE